VDSENWMEEGGGVIVGEGVVNLEGNYVSVLC
jgi:hypothetical protein